MDTPHNYTEEEIKELKERAEKADKALKELGLMPIAKVEKINIKYEGKDVFADHIYIIFQDLKKKTNKE